MVMVFRGARRFPLRSFKRVVLPAPLAPMRSVRLPQGRVRLMFERPGWVVLGNV